MQADPGVVEAGQHVGGAVAAAVVDDDQLDLARIVARREPASRALAMRALLVVDGHEDGQLHHDSTLSFNQPVGEWPPVAL